MILALLFRCFFVLLTCPEPLSPHPVVDASATSTDSMTVTWTYNSSLTFVEMWRVTATPIQEDYPGSVNKTVDNSHEYYVRVSLAKLTSGVTYSINVKAIVKSVLSDVSSKRGIVSEYLSVFTQHHLCTYCSSFQFDRQVVCVFLLNSVTMVL